MPTEHTVRAYDDELDSITAELARMGGLAEAEVAESIRAISRRDVNLATEVIDRDARLDEIELEIERRAVVLIALRQPVADDLRRIVAALKISMNLERCGDLAKNIAKRTAAIGTERQPRQVSRGVNHMADLALLQLRDVLDACANRDAAKAVAVRSRDGEIDALYNSLFRELLTYMMEDPRAITMSTHLLFCAKNIERIGDHATNIAETVYYLVTGDRLTGERQKDDSHNYATVPFQPPA